MVLRAITYLVVSVLYVVSFAVSIKIEQIQLPEEIERCINKTEYCSKLENVTEDSLTSACLDLMVKRLQDDQSKTYPNSSKFFQRVFSLLRNGLHRREKRQTRPCIRARVRKEIRRLSRREWRRLSRAINGLKDKGDWDRLAAIHRGLTRLRAAHGGPNFLGWHRIYLILVEDFLRREVRCVTIPYWDSTLDFDMDDPTLSILWAQRFLGNGDGVVRTGPFANWITGQGDPLMRNIGSGGSLISSRNFWAVLSRRNHAQITDFSDPLHNIEMNHNGPHVWVDGHMRLLDGAAEDPVFYMHHAFIDCWWQWFRQRLTNRHGINPYDDYPETSGLHADDRQMDPFAEMEGFESITNRDGYHNFWSTIYRCQRRPTCGRLRPNGCNSRFLFCNRTIWRCVSRARRVSRPLMAAANVGMSAALARPTLPQGIVIESFFVDNRTTNDPLQQTPQVQSAQAGPTISGVQSGVSTIPGVGSGIPIAASSNPDFRELDTSFIRLPKYYLIVKNITRWTHKRPVRSTHINIITNKNTNIDCSLLKRNAMPKPSKNLVEELKLKDLSDIKNLIFIPIMVVSTNKDMKRNHGDEQSKYSTYIIGIQGINTNDTYNVPLVAENNKTTIESSIPIIRHSVKSMDVFLSARTLNGRKCLPKCLIANGPTQVYRSCSGALRIIPETMNVNGPYNTEAMIYQAEIPDVLGHKKRVFIQFDCTRRL